MFMFKKAILMAYLSEATGAELKFRQSSQSERNDLELYIQSESEFKNNKSLLASWATRKDDYYAAWLLEGFGNVQENGKAHRVEDFALRDKVDLIRELKKADPEFAPWLAFRCEPAEKKTEEDAPTGELVGSEGVPDLQVDQ